jgi:hypothetical protein
MTIGTVIDAVHDSYVVAVNFGTSGVFDDTPVSAVVVTATAPNGGTVPTVGTPVIAANVVTFRLTASTTAGYTYHVTIDASNGAGDELCRSIEVPTEAC